MYSTAELKRNPNGKDIGKDDRETKEICISGAILCFKKKE
jgi:hypothetical protein